MSHQSADDFAVTQAFVPSAASPDIDPSTTVGVATTVDSVPPPAVVPGYQLLRELGRGGMGVVYLATQDGLNRQVALKMVLSGDHASATEKGRFLAEAEAVAAVRHPGVVQVFDFGTHDGRPFFALEFLPGGSLAARLNGTPLPAKEAATLVEGIARAVQAAHEVGVIHRDLKPGNILFDADGLPKVTDFGLARKGDTQSGLTATGAILGTPSYMAPEQAEGRKDVGPAADVYAVGAVLYECLTGRPPFRAATPLETIHQVLKDEPVPPSRFTPKLPRDLETVALKCLSKDPRKRYATAGELADDLRRYLSGEPIVARPVSAVERGWRWVKRNPTVGTVAGLVFGALGAIVGLQMSANAKLERERNAARTAEAEAKEQRGEAERQRQAARNRLQSAVEAVDRMMTRVAGERWATNPALQEERRQVLEDAAAFYTELAAEVSDDPLVRHETARAHARVAAAHQALGDLGKTEASARAAVALYEGLIAADAAHPDYPAEASEMHSVLGNAAALRADFAAALKQYQAAVGLAKRSVELRPDDPAYLIRVVQASAGECFFYLHSEPTRGRTMAADTLALARRIGGTADAPFDHRMELAYTLFVSASFDLAGGGGMKAAAAKYAEADGVLKGLADARPPSARVAEKYAYMRAIITVQLGVVAQTTAVGTDGLRRAVGLMGDGLGGLNALLRVHPRAFPYLSVKLPTLAALAFLHRKLGEGAEADAALAELDELEDAVRRDNPAMFWIGRLSRASRSQELSERVSRGEFDRLEADLTRFLDSDRRVSDGDSTYDVACVYSLASAKATDAGRKEGWAAKAVALLTELVDTGYYRTNNRTPHLDKDPDLATLRDRDDYKAFRAAVDKSNAAAAKPK